MAKKSIVAVGVEVPSDDIAYVRFTSRESLLDWDIIIFRPDVGELAYTYDEYQGKPCLDDRKSFQLKEACEHWRREIREAFDAGKTVVVYLAPVREMYIATGEKSFSGTGRNRVTTLHVAPYDNYRSIPATLNPVPSRGSAMRLAPNGAEFLVPYWTTFGGRSAYAVRLQEPRARACVVTKTGSRLVGVVIRSKSGAGTLLMLPDLEFDSGGFIEEREGKEYWTKKATDFGRELTNAILGLHKALQSEAAITPEPDWAAAPEYVLAPEAALRSRLLIAERAAEDAQRKLETLRDEMVDASRMRALLFEKGKPLEAAIIEALRILRFWGHHL